MELWILASFSRRSSQGKSILAKLELQKIATIPLDGKIYAILHPVDDDIPENAAFVFRLDLDEQMLTIEEDGDTADAVFDEYFRTMEAEEK